jgi:choline kinase
MRPLHKYELVEIGGKPILWHIMKMYSTHGINDFVICCGYKGYVDTYLIHPLFSKFVTTALFLSDDLLLL